MMKKVYRKPEIMFEHLELDNAISACDYMVAADCQDVTPDNGIEDIPYDVVDTIDGGVYLPQECSQLFLDTTRVDL